MGRCCELYTLPSRSICIAVEKEFINSIASGLQHCAKSLHSVPSIGA